MLMPVHEALEQVLATVQPLDSEVVDLRAALGRVIAADVVSDMQAPPFDNSSMDGYAVRATDVAQVPVQLCVSMDVPAGAIPTQPLGVGEAARIMTGAPLPNGADTIIPVEHTDASFAVPQIIGTVVTIQQAGKVGAYVRRAGEDFMHGELLIPAGTHLRAVEIGVLAALGRAQITVRRRPRVALLTSGDELLEYDQPMRVGAIRDANTPTLAALVTELGGEPLPLRIGRDTLEDVQAVFAAALALRPDAIVNTAGMSVGAFDFVRAVLAKMGQINFWQINLRPGKPFAFGVIDGVPFFGLPGNPVSAMVTFDVLVRPALLKMLAAHDPTVTVNVITAEPIPSDGRQSYVRVRLARGEQGGWLASLTGTQSSGAITSMLKADGLLIVPQGVTLVPAGSVLPVRVLRLTALRGDDLG
jgi:molybdopterin molybdotransferase